TVILPREPHRDADREQQSEVREDRIARRRDRRDTEQVRLTQVQQQRRDRQYGDRQHQRAADRLQTGDDLLHEVTLVCVRKNSFASTRTSSAVSCSSACSASLRHISNVTARIKALSSGTIVGTTDSSRTPRPIRIGTAA